jgi:hypothetical protein
MTHTYAPTERGIHFLRIFEEMDKLISLDDPTTVPAGK